MKIFTRLLIFIVRLYQKFISPLKRRSSCRFYPTCSTYTIQALKKYGAIKGGFMAVKRILSCHPFNSGGYDPVE